MTEDSEEEAEPSAAAEEHEYEVGYGRPPRHSRFKPGRSGNPRGRPKGAVDRKTIVERVFLARHTVIEQGKRRQRTVLELVLLALRNRAIDGNSKAFSKFHDLFERYGPQDTRVEGAYIFMPEPLSVEEQQQEMQRVRGLEQKREQTWEPKKRR
jgi:Family of unknown function (DUF5681)